MGTLDQIVIDCAHPATLARFWARVLDDWYVRPYDDAEIERLAARGFTPETDPTVMLDGPYLTMCFQRVEDAATRAKRPLHLDVRTGARSQHASRLVAAGATIVEEFVHHTWLRDPEGNDFCLTDDDTVT